MNISRITKKIAPFLNPIEETIMSQPIEHLYKFDKKGNILKHFSGNKTSVQSDFIPDAFGSVHNHDRTCRNTFLSPSDIYLSIIDKEHESRVVTNDGFCLLVEIPVLSASRKIKCYDILKDFIKLGNDAGGYTRMSIKNMRKILEKVGGLKFRTIPITPEAKEFVKNLKKQKEVL